MSSETIDIELESDNPSVLEVKKKISEIKDTENSVIKLIFSGKVLDDNKDMKFYKIDETQQIICMIRKTTTSNQTNQVPEPQTQQVPLNINPPNNTPNNTPNLNFGSLPNMANLPGMPNLNAMPAADEMQSLQGLLQNPQMSQMMGNIMQNPQMREMMLNSTLQRLNIPPDSPMRSFYENMLTSFFNNPDQYLNMMAQMPNMPNMPNMPGMNPNANFLNMMNGMGPPQSQPHQPPPVQTQPPVSMSTPNDNVEPSSNEEESNNPITNPTQQPSLNTEEIKQKYSEQIEEIKMMGFDDENKIIEAIAQSYGSVSIALNKLLE